MKNNETEQAFEVEDIKKRKNYTFHYRPNDSVLMVDTSLGSHENILCEFPADTNKESITAFPFGCKTSYEYFVHMYNKALHGTEIVFLGWVDPKNYKPLEESL